MANAEVAPPARGWLRHVVPLAISAAAIALAILVGWSLRGVPELGGAAPLPPPPSQARPRRRCASTPTRRPRGSTSATRRSRAAPAPTSSSRARAAASSSTWHTARSSCRSPSATAGRRSWCAPATPTSSWSARTSPSTWDGHGDGRRARHRGRRALVRRRAGSARRGGPGVAQRRRDDRGEGPRRSRSTRSVDKDPLHGRTASLPEAHVAAPAAHTGSDGSAAATAKHALDDPKDPHHDLKAEIRAQALLPAMDVGAPRLEAGDHLLPRHLEEQVRRPGREGAVLDRVHADDALRGRQRADLARPVHPPLRDQARRVTPRRSGCGSASSACARSTTGAAPPPPPTSSRAPMARPSTSPS